MKHCVKFLSLALVTVVAMAFFVTGAMGLDYVRQGQVPTPIPGVPVTAPWIGNQFIVELIDDGSFEGAVANWFVQNTGSGLWYVWDGTPLPDSGSLPQAPPDGLLQAVTDQGGPGSHILYQDVTIPAGNTADLNLIYWVENQAGVYINPPTLDENAGANQQARIDIMDPAFPVDDMGAGILLNLFETLPGDPTSIPPTALNANLDAFAGQTIRLRFAEADNQFFFNFGVDAVSIQADGAVPTEEVTWGAVKSMYKSE